MDEFYTVAQAAVVLKVHPLTVRRYIKEGKLKASRAGGNVRINVSDIKNFVQDFMASQQTTKVRVASVTKEFSFSDPIFQLRGRGFSMSKEGE